MGRFKAWIGEHHGWSLRFCKSQPPAKGKLLDRSPLICIVCLHGWPTLLLLMLLLSPLLVAACC